MEQHPYSRDDMLQASIVTKICRTAMSKHWEDVGLATGKTVECSRMTSEAVEASNVAAVTFIHYLTDAALDAARRAKRSTINRNEVLSGLADCNMEWMVDDLELELAGEVPPSPKRARDEETVVKADGTGAQPAVKRQKSGYFVFMGEHRARVKEQNPGAAVSELAKLMGEEWRNLTAEEKAKYTGKPVSEKGDQAELNAVAEPSSPELDKGQVVDAVNAQLTAAAESESPCS
jgi:histone H3/H4